MINHPIEVVANTNILVAQVVDSGSQSFQFVAYSNQVSLDKNFPKNAMVLAVPTSKDKLQIVEIKTKDIDKDKHQTNKSA